MAIALLGPDRLPPGPLRDFFEALHDLYDRAGQPGARVISTGIRQDHSLPETVSHETISAALRGSSLPSWAKVRSIVVELARESIGAQDHEAVVVRFRDLWLAARAWQVQGQSPNVGTQSAVAPAAVRGVVTPPPIVAPRQASPDSQIVGGLPDRNPRFVGRDTLLQKMRAELQANPHSPLVLFGIGGVGKSHLVREYIHHYEHHYEVIWWVPADRADRARAALVSLADRLRVPDHGNAEQTALGVIALLESRQVGYLLVFDGAEDGDIRRLMPTQGGHVIVTTRDPGIANESSSNALEVPTFDQAEAIQFLRARDPELSGPEADALAGVFGRVPVALEHMAVLRADGLTWDELSAPLDGSRTGDPHYPESVRASVILALSRLSSQNPVAALILELFAWLGSDPVSIALLRAGKGGAVAPALTRALQNPVVLGKAITAICQVGLARLHSEGQRIEVQPVIRAALLDTLADDARERGRQHVHDILAAADPGPPDDLPSWDMHREMAAHVLPAGLVLSTVEAAQQTVLNQIRYRYLIGEFEEAAHLGQTAVTAWRAADFLGPDHEMVLLATREWAASLRTVGRYTSSRELTRDALQRLLDNPAYGLDHEQTLAMATSHAADLRLAGEYAEALRIDEETHRHSLARWGEKHPRTTMSRYGLGVSLRLVGDFARAWSADTTELDRHRELHGDRHATTLRWVNALAEDLYGLGRYGEVLDLQQHQREIGGRLAPIRNVLMAQRTMALAQRGLGELWQAFEALWTHYHQCFESFGDEHEHTLAATMSYANVLRQRGLIDEAHRYATESVSGYRKTFGPLNPLTLAAEVNLGAVLRAMGERNQARQVDTAARDALRSSLGDGHPFTIAATANLATDHALAEDVDEALELSERAFELALRIRGRHHPDTLAVAANLSLDRRALQVTEDADELVSEVLTTLRRTLGPDHPTVTNVASGNRLELDLEPPPST